MKKFLIIAMISGAPYAAHALSLIPDVVQQPDCCIGNRDGTCTHFTCTWNGTKTEYTDCDTCNTTGTILQKNGSYQPCGTNSALFDESVGKCVTGAIAVFCTTGQYNNNGVCTDCPDGGTSDFGASARTECYIPAGTVGSGTTGTFTYTENCYYSDDTSAILKPILP